MNTISTVGFPFLKLPSKLRHQIYVLALPRQKRTDPNSIDWAVFEKARKSTALLCVSRAIHREAAPVLYLSACYTLSITLNPSPFFLSVIFDENGSTAAKLSKNWQLSIDELPNVPAEGAPRKLERSKLLAKDKRERKAWHHIQKQLDFCARGLASIYDLKTLKVRVPCHCQNSDALALTRLGAFYSWGKKLALLKHVRVYDSCMFLAARKGEYEQCPEVECQYLAWKFGDLKNVIEGIIPEGEIKKIRGDSEVWSRG